jgi:hypothetical protein
MLSLDRVLYTLFAERMNGTKENLLFPLISHFHLAHLVLRLNVEGKNADTKTMSLTSLPWSAQDLLLVTSPERDTFHPSRQKYPRTLVRDSATHENRIITGEAAFDRECSILNNLSCDLMNYGMVVLRISDEQGKR